MNNYKRLNLIVISAILTALSFIVIYLVPTIDLGIWSFTLGSHVPIMIGMFISPVTAVFTYLGTLFTFMIKTPNVIVWFRAASHIFFIIAGLFLMKKWKTLNSNILDIHKGFFTISLFVIIIAFIHALFEVLAIYFCMFLNTLGNISIAIPSTGTYYLFFTVGLGTFVHTILDFTIAYIIYLPIKKSKII